MSSNFAFLETQFPALANLGALAELYVDTDPNSSLIKMGMLGEQMVLRMFEIDNIRENDNSTSASRITELSRRGLLPEDVTKVLHLIRKARNKAVHQQYDDASTARTFLPIIHSLCVWFCTAYGTLTGELPTFVWADSAVDAAQAPALEQQSEALAERDEQAAREAEPVPVKVRREKAEDAAKKRPKTEAETRLLIDAQLRQVGWEVDTQKLRYADGTRPVAGRNLAIAEWPTNSSVGERGYADYALFVGTHLVGVVEAKRYHTDISSVLDYQARDYARSIKPEHHEYVIDRWADSYVPFIYATNGKPYLEQYKTKSGIWFQDLRNPANAPRALSGWPSPDGLKAILEADIAAGQHNLHAMSYDFLQNRDGLNLRDYQLAAIQAAEGAIAQGSERILLAMATGTGKTRMVLGLIYRMLKAKRFRRILFLVDRTSLGEQAMDTFADVKLEELMSLTELYDIKELGDAQIDAETKVSVATVQSMVRRIQFAEEESKPAVTDYDLVIVDEAHRGYLLDKEMGDDELAYRDQYDYQSAYRAVLDYFDATTVALTATPALHTTEIFGQPVFTYSYREAVLDGWLVDHDAPHRLRTKLSEGGITFKKGQTVPVFDPETGEITNSAELEDDVTFDVEAFNRKVITEDFNRTVLEEIAKDLLPEDPDEYGKTLIYAVDDAHADLIVSLLKEIYADQDVPADAIQKITGSVAGGNPKKIKAAIRNFKNERFPSIVVTVDLLTTGIDVPSITSLVFLRRVKSRILFEQMLGRATRLCPDIKKDKFEIYDPVGVYEALEPVNTMKPLAANPQASFADLMEGLKADLSSDGLKEAVRQVVAKLQRRKNRLNAEDREQVQALSDGKDIEEVIADLKGATPQAAAQWAREHTELFTYLDAPRTPKPWERIISDAPDELISHGREYGITERPEDYLDEFTEYVRDNLNEIQALSIIATRPAQLTREDLKSLRLELNRAGFTEPLLQRALAQVSNKEIAADIIAMVRRASIGSALLSHSERVSMAMTKLKANHSFTRAQEAWLDRIEKILQREYVISVADFDADSRLREKGGRRKADSAFEGNLASIVDEFNQYMYEDKQVKSA